MPLICPIPLDETYDLPQGRYRARLVKVRPETKLSHRGPTHLIRLLFEVQIPSLKNRIPMAGRNFPFDLGRKSDLRGFLEAWKGAELFANGADCFDFEALVCGEADIVLRHVTNANHRRPYVLVESIHPPGTKRLTEKPVVVAEACEELIAADGLREAA